MMRFAIALAAVLVGACNSTALPIGNPSDMPPVVVAMPEDASAEAPPADADEVPDDTAKACGGAGQPCCDEGVSLLPSSSRLLQGVGSCGDGLACAQTGCPPLSTCLDGRFNDELKTIYITYCTSD
jgi:hypothetical protein